MEQVNADVKEIKDVKDKGNKLFQLVNSKGVLGKKLYCVSHYNADTKTYCLYEYNDVNTFRFVKATQKVLAI